jgi:hypothetical protein
MLFLGTKYTSLIEWEFAWGEISSCAKRFDKFSKPPAEKPVNTISVCVQFLPAAGYRNNSNGSLNNRGYNGNYWSTRKNSNNNNAYNMNFNSSGTNNNNNNRANGFSVRCITEFIINSK